MIYIDYGANIQRKWENTKKKVHKMEKALRKDLKWISAKKTFRLHSISFFSLNFSIPKKFGLIPFASGVDAREAGGKKTERCLLKGCEVWGERLGGYG